MCPHPLLAATLTRDPLGVASVEVASQLPWLLFALAAGALVDRWDRRRVLWRTDAYRALVLTALTVAIVAGWASIPCSGRPGSCSQWGGTVFTPATMSIIPGLVSRHPARLERANSRLARRRVGLAGSGSRKTLRLRRRELKAPKKTAPRRSGRWGCRKYGRHACGSARGTPLRSPRPL
jgi:hypothetical protein